MPDPMRGRCLALVALALALACASSPPSGGGSPETLHEGYGVRVRLPDWEVYGDAGSAPLMLRPLFEGKRGPDDPPLLVARRDDLILTISVQSGISVDSAAFYAAFSEQLEGKGVVTYAAKLPGSDDILMNYHAGVGALSAHSRGLVHVEGGRLVNVMLIKPGEEPPEQAFADALRGIELRGGEGWVAPWQLDVPIRAVALEEYRDGPVGKPRASFEAVECEPGEHPLLWVVRGERGARVHLFGSIHVGHASFYPLAAPIEDAFARSQRLVVEVDPRGGAALEDVYEQAAIQPVGKRLSDVVSPELYARVGEAAESLGMPVEVFDLMSPGNAGIVLSMAPILARGFDPGAGVDVYFLDRAEGKQVLELESVQEQLGLISSHDETFLRSALEGLDTIDADIDALHRAWRCGDEEALGSVVFDRPRERARTPEDRALLEQFNEVFLYERNHAMVLRIEDLLELGGESFVVVGVAHLVREQGIPMLLRAEGHPVERVGNAP